MPLEISNDSLFDQRVDLIVNPVNCFGAWGAGIARQFKNLFPDAWQHHRQYCQQNKPVPGDVLWLRDYNIICVHTKDHWKDPSRIEWVVRAMENFMRLDSDYELGSVGMPMLGVGLGGLDYVGVYNTMCGYLQDALCDVVLCVDTRKI